MLFRLGEASDDSSEESEEERVGVVGDEGLSPADVTVDTRHTKLDRECLVKRQRLRKLISLHGQLPPLRPVTLISLSQRNKRTKEP